MVQFCNKLLPIFVSILSKQTARYTVSGPSLRALRPFSCFGKQFQLQSEQPAHSVLAGKLDRFGGVTVRDFPPDISEDAFSILLKGKLLNPRRYWRNSSKDTHRLLMVINAILQ